MPKQSFCLSCNRQLDALFLGPHFDLRKIVHDNFRAVDSRVWHSVEAPPPVQGHRDNPEQAADGFP